MPPEVSDTTTANGSAAAVCTTTPTPTAPQQFLYIIRHGDRWDYENKEWPGTTDRPGDPPLSSLGWQQARETGRFLDSILVQDGISNLDDITWLSSPFLRTLQTSDAAIGQLSQVAALSHKNQNNNLTTTSPSRLLAQFSILPEYSVFEWDGKDGAWHEDLPDLTERVHYFPRLNVTHKSLFVPTLPEPRSQFHDRCQRAMTALSQRYPCPTANTDDDTDDSSSQKKKNSAIVIVTRGGLHWSRQGGCSG